ncbi:MAG: dihydrolipoyl dehydrogenase [Planctomycetota bacterium]|nr:dihydrolipoyl dehydrogenase [Planctomycetota bacterium]
MADQKHYDLIVIGSGPGGYVGAIRAAQLGMKTACIERDRLGGVCLNWGCIPSKALLHNAELYREAVINGEEWGFSFEKAKFDWKKIIGRSRGITDQITSGVGFLLKKNNIDHIKGHAKITSGKTAHGPCTIEVRKAKGDYYHGEGEGDATETLTADRIIIATGAAPIELPFAPFDGKTVISSFDAMNLPKQPKSMVIVGSGAIGMEFAYFYNAFGTDVTVVEMLDRILPVEDDDVSKVAHRVFKKQGITFHTTHTVSAIEKNKSGAKVTITSVKDESKTHELDAEIVLVAIGVKARFEGLFDDSLGLVIERNHIKTDFRDQAEPTYQTSVPGIYAIGDVIGPPWLAHIASEEAIACIERMNGHHTLGVDYEAFPGCTYCNPQIGSIGMTERAVKEKGIDYQVGKYQLKAHGKAIAIGATEGMAKIITSKPYGEILGAHIIGEDASELIAEISLAIRLEATAEDIISTIHAHPTMHEAIHEATLATEGRAIHQ